MKKSILYIIIFAGTICFLAALWVIGRLTGALQVYKITVTSNEPSLKFHSNQFATNLLKPDVGDFIAYHYFDKGKKYINIHRLCASEGDTVYINKGVLYVNGQNIDKSLNLKNEYVLPSILAYSLKDKGYLQKDEIRSYSTDSVYAYLDDKTIEEKKLACRRIIDTSVDKEIQAIYKQSWGIDNFGPIVIPQGQMFVLGDNRHNALDSRFAGFISVDRYVGTLP